MSYDQNQIRDALIKIRISPELREMALTDDDMLTELVCLEMSAEIDAEIFYELKHKDHIARQIESIMSTVETVDWSRDGF